MARCAALLRAINVGGRNRVPMAQLRELMERLGYTAVETYVQSGNVVFTAPRTSGLEPALEKAYAKEFGFEIPVIVRTGAQLRKIVEADPLGDIATDPSRRIVYFLAEKIAATRLAGLDLASFEPDVIELRGREIHLWAPDGQGRSKLAQALTPKRLGTHATARNWRTVEKLLDMTGN
jgi:uncharacterized protein (DUF1697 family)